MDTLLRNLRYSLRVLARAPAFSITVVLTLALAIGAEVSGRHSLQWLFVGIQVALSVTLLAGAGVLLRSFIELSRVDPGFEPTHVLSFRVSGTFVDFPRRRARRAARARARIRSRRASVGCAAGSARELRSPRCCSRGLAIAAIGIAVGTGIALGATRVARSLLYGVAPHDPMSYAAAAALLLAACLTAAAVPALRTARVDPMTTLRRD